MLTELKEVRKELGMTQDEFAAMLGISRNYVALIETGRRNTPVTLLQKARDLVDKKSADGTTAQPEFNDVAYWRDRALAAEDVLRRVRSALDAVSGYRPPPPD